ncbi:hypothetical protein EDB19DRAFT_1917260 [Suillus lakei]|nr:hypothetical protein EDB19DRAFT_1917260 [Suillus lakei]
MTFPHRHETKVGQRGVRVSLLDDTTSVLDGATKRGCWRYHASIKGADSIMVLKDRQIVEQGSHRELVELSSLFASMWADQISASEDPKAPAGYDVDDDAPVVNIPESETRSTAGGEEYEAQWYTGAIEEH